MRTFCTRRVIQRIVRQMAMTVVAMMGTWIGALRAGDGLQWREMPALPRALAGHMCLAQRGEIVSLGGTYWTENRKHWSDRAWVFDASGQAWRQGWHLPEPVAYGVLVSDGGNLELIGGASEAGASRRVYDLDSANGSIWTRAGDLPEPRVHACGGIIGDRVYIVGGTRDANDFSTATASMISRAIHEKNGTWRTHHAIPDAGMALAAGAVCNGGLYVFGGMKISGRDVVNLDGAWAFDAAKEQWRALRRLPFAVRGASGCTYANRYIFLIGGHKTVKSQGEFSSDVWIYDVQANQFAYAGAAPRGAITQAVVAGDDIVLIAGEDLARHRTDRVASISAKVLLTAAFGGKAVLHNMDTINE